MVLALATRGLWVFRFFSSPQEPVVSKSNSIRNDRRRTTNLDVLPPNCYFIKLFFFPSTQPVFPSAHPSLLPSEAQKSQFSLQGETVDEVRLEQNESAVRFVSSSHCITLPSGLCCVRTVLPLQ